MTNEEKVLLLAKFFSEKRIEDDPHAKELAALDADWDDVYRSNRKLSFYNAELMANMAIISKLLFDTPTA